MTIVSSPAGPPRRPASCGQARGGRCCPRSRTAGHALSRSARSRFGSTPAVDPDAGSVRADALRGDERIHDVACACARLVGLATRVHLLGIAGEGDRALRPGQHDDVLAMDGVGPALADGDIEGGTETERRIAAGSQPRTQDIEEDLAEGRRPRPRATGWAPPSGWAWVSGSVTGSEKESVMGSGSAQASEVSSASLAASEGRGSTLPGSAATAIAPTAMPRRASRGDDDAGRRRAQRPRFVGSGRRRTRSERGPVLPRGHRPRGRLAGHDGSGHDRRGARVIVRLESRLRGRPPWRCRWHTDRPDPGRARVGPPHRARPGSRVGSRAATW